MISRSEPQRYHVQRNGRRYDVYLYPDGKAKSVTAWGRNGRRIYRVIDTCYGRGTLAVIELAREQQKAGVPA